MMTTPRFKIERKNGTVTWLYAAEDISTGTKWAIPTSLGNELNRLYDLEAEHESTKQELGQALDEAAKCARAAALFLLKDWDDSDGWDYELSPDELGDRKRDGYTVQYRNRLYSNAWVDSGLTELNLRRRSVAAAARYYRASKQPSSPPASTTENVPLHKVIGRDVLEGGEWKQVAGVMYAHAHGGWQYVTRGGCWRPLPVDDLGTVAVLVDAPAATSDKGAS